MRLFGKVNSTIDRFDRAVWVTGGPWGGFDLALGAPVIQTPYEISAAFDIQLSLAGTFDNQPAIASIFDIEAI